MIEITYFDIEKSQQKNKKFKAIFKFNLLGKERKRTIHFGDSRYEDYTQHHDKKRRMLYKDRHKTDNIRNPISAGALSWYLLWGDSTSFQDNLKQFKKKFGIFQ